MRLSAQRREWSVCTVEEGRSLHREGDDTCTQERAWSVCTGNGMFVCILGYFLCRGEELIYGHSGQNGAVCTGEGNIFVHRA